MASAAATDRSVIVEDNVETLEEEYGSDEEDDIFVSVQNSDDGRQSWLREARSICGEDIETLASEAASEFPITSPRESVGEETSVLLSAPLIDDILCPSPNIDDDNHNVLVDANSIESELRNKHVIDDKMSKIIDKTVEEDDYVFQASVSMSDAIEQEELGNHEAAFEMYKFGIGILLRGVQIDNNIERREAVRRKSAQYLLRAEQLYKASLTDVITCDNIVTLDDNKWRFRLSDVKVFGVVDKVMLVQKIFGDDVFIMKVLHKQGAEYKRTTHNNKRTRKQPRNLYNSQYMVNLFNCVETQTGVYLLLEYVAGGKLWDFLNIPLFSHTRNRRPSSCAESHHSWNTTGCSFAENVVDDECTDIIDIPISNYVRQGPSELSQNQQQSNISTSRCKIKRSPSQTVGLTEDYLRTWCAQIALALIDLHSKNVICR